MINRTVVNFLLAFVMLVVSVGYPTRIGFAQEITATPPTNQYGVAVGVHLRPSSSYANDIREYNSQAGKNAAILMYFTDFDYGLDGYLLSKIQSLQASERPVVMLTVLPYEGRKSKGCDRDYSGFIGYDNFNSGKCDGFIRNFATLLSNTSGIRFIVRFAHEMNIPISPYWPGHSGKSPADYIQMYRRFFDIFTATQQASGKVNTEFAWAPNYFSDPAESWNFYFNYYPGDTYVHWIALSGYNWYPANGEPNRSFKQIYGDLDGTDAYYSDAGFHPGILYDLSCRYAKPIILAEFGALHTSSTVSNKVNWITDAYSKIPAHPFVRAVVWFNDFAYQGTDKDFRVLKAGTISPVGVPSEITSAYKTAIQNSAYRSVLPSLADATPPSTYCWTDVDKAGRASFTLSTNRVVLERNDSAEITLTGLLVSDVPSVSLEKSTPAFNASIVNNDLTVPWGELDFRLSTGSNAAVGNYQLTVKITSQSVVTSLPVTVQVVDKLYQLNLPTVLRSR